MPKGTTKKKARESMRDIEDQVAKGICLPDLKIPLFGKVAKDWLEYKKPNLRASTWRMYKGHTENHFDDLKGIKVNRITTAKVEKYITDRLEGGTHITTLRKLKDRNLLFPITSMSKRYLCVNTLLNTACCVM